MLPIEVGRTNAPFPLKSFHKNSGNIGSDMAQILGESGLVFCGEMKLSLPLELFTR